MTFKNIKLIACLALISGYAAKAQTAAASRPDTIIMPVKSPVTIVDHGIRNEQSWRNTGAVFTITGEELARTNAGNLLNTSTGQNTGAYGSHRFGRARLR